MRIALAQINPTVGDLPGNQDRILSAARKAASLGARMVIFPEMAVCGYPPEDLLYKKAFVRGSERVIDALAVALPSVGIVTGFVESGPAGEVYNAVVFLYKEKRVVYHKRYLPNYGVFDEKRYFCPGKEPVIFDFQGRRFELSVCEDIWEDVWRDRPGLRDVLINVSGSPYDVGKFDQRKDLLRKRARQTAARVAYVNLVGGQDELVFDGGSMVVGPDGRLEVLGREFEEDLVLWDVDQNRSSVDEKMRISSSVERIRKALILGTRDYVRKNGFQKVVIGLSGGIDSAVVAVIATEALGRENVVAVVMPSRYNVTETQADARILAGRLGVTCKEIAINDLMEAYDRALSREFAGTTPNIAEENLQARIRGNILMALSNKFGWLVLTTGNKSEMAVGYCTLYGDMSGGFAVLKDVPKKTVYALAGLINQDKEIIPHTIISRPPSAELRANQKDQDSLPPYEILDAIIEGYVERHQSVEALSRLYPPEVVREVVGRVDRSEYKRRQAPPGVKITPRAFGKDWRLPITNGFRP